MTDYTFMCILIYYCLSDSPVRWSLWGAVCLRINKDDIWDKALLNTSCLDSLSTSILRGGGDGGCSTTLASIWEIPPWTAHFRSSGDWCRQSGGDWRPRVEWKWWEGPSTRKMYCFGKADHTPWLQVRCHWESNSLRGDKWDCFIWKMSFKGHTEEPGCSVRAYCNFIPSRFSLL